jgi:hypothetical protein
MPHVQKTGAAAASEELVRDEYYVLALRRNNAEPLIVLPWPCMGAPPRTGAAVNAPASLAQFQQAEQRQVDPLLAFVVRAEAWALLWQAGELNLHKAVDTLRRYCSRAWGLHSWRCPLCRGRRAVLPARG